jgi:FkbM family methyltransferase
MIRYIKKFLAYQNRKATLDSKSPCSFSQSGEDMIIRFVLRAMGVDKPNYIDIGAHHPFRLNNTAHFYESGCVGINIEPNSFLYKEFEKHRPLDKNLNIGISEQTGSLDFYIIQPSTMSTFSLEEAHYLENQAGFKIIDIQKVPVLPLGEVLKNKQLSQLPHFMSIDVEGYEEKVLRSFDFQVWSPLVICCETIQYSASGIACKNHIIIELLQSKGYFIYADTYINTIFVLKQAWENRNVSSQC